LIGSTIPELRTTFLPQRLEKIDRELAIYRPKFTERDPIIRNLELQRVSIINLMNETTKDYLKVKRKDALANLNAAKRGEDIIFLYNELQKKASMDDITLVNLKNELRLLELEKTRYLNPWELITKPTLLDKPVSPDKKRVIGLSFILGLISGSFYVLLRKNNKERI
jgi:LPS O-antigen subunit length determinant protein (WzzB/FepE family)